MTPISRRTLLRTLSAAPAAAALVWTEAEARQAHEHAEAARTAADGQSTTAFTPRFFTPHEYATVGILVDLIIPRDERSGSATEAGVPEFMDFMMIDNPGRQTAMRGGLAWIDRECVKRWDKPFADCTAVQQTALLEDIAWPGRAKPDLLHGTTFFSSFRDLTASGFWTTKMGFTDLQYMGNTFVPEWKGCPGDVLKKLGLTPNG